MTEMQPAVKQEGRINIRPSDRDFQLKHEEIVGKLLEKISLQDTTEQYKANLAVLTGLLNQGFDARPLIGVLRIYGRESIDRNGSGKPYSVQIVNPPRIVIPGMTPGFEEEGPGFFSRIGGFFSNALHLGGGRD